MCEYRDENVFFKVDKTLSKVISLLIFEIKSKRSEQIFKNSNIVSSYQYFMTK